jgi:histone H3
MEIRRLQKSTELVIPRLAFSRLVREVLLGCAHEPLRIQSSALSALQEAAEARLINELSGMLIPGTLVERNINKVAVAQLCAIHAKRVTLQAKDMALVKKLRCEI